MEDLLEERGQCHLCCDESLDTVPLALKYGSVYETFNLCHLFLGVLSKRQLQPPTDARPLVQAGVIFFPQFTLELWLSINNANLVILYLTFKLCNNDM